MNTSETHPYILELGDKLRNLEKSEAALRDAQLAVQDNKHNLMECILLDTEVATHVLSINTRKLKSWIYRER